MQTGMHLYGSANNESWSGGTITVHLAMFRSWCVPHEWLSEDGKTEWRNCGSKCWGASLARNAQLRYCRRPGQRNIADDRGVFVDPALARAATVGKRHPETREFCFGTMWRSM